MNKNWKNQKPYPIHSIKRERYSNTTSQKSQVNSPFSESLPQSLLSKKKKYYLKNVLG